MGVLLTTNPLRTINTTTGPGHIDDHIPIEPMYKILGLTFAIPSTLLIGTEGMPALTLTMTLANEHSDDYAHDGGPTRTHPGIGYFSHHTICHYCMVGVDHTYLRMRTT